MPVAFALLSIWTQFRPETKRRYAMANKNGKDDVNEELPDEYEVIQHSIRDKPDKQQKNARYQDNQKHVATPGSKSGSPAAGTEKRRRQQP
jgi:hypothetical protein